MEAVDGIIRFVGVLVVAAARAKADEGEHLGVSSFICSRVW